MLKTKKLNLSFEIDYDQTAMDLPYQICCNLIGKLFYWNISKKHLKHKQKQ
jgi:hypothetical protein